MNTTKFNLSMILSVAVLVCSMGSVSCRQPMTHTEMTELGTVRERLRDYAGLDPDAVFMRLKELRTAVRRHDAVRLSHMINYPIMTLVGKQRLIIESAEDFAARYDEIMNPEFRQAILGIRDQDVFVNWKGMMVLDGRIWFDFPQVRVFDSTPLNPAVGSVTNRLDYLIPRGREILNVLPSAEQEIAWAHLQKSGWIPDPVNLRYKAYRADLNNDGQADIIVTSFTVGSGNFSSIESVWTGKDPEVYQRLPLEQVFAKSFGIPESEFEWCDVQEYLANPFLIRAEGGTCFGFDDPPEYYLWQDDTITKANPGQEMPR